MFLSNVDSSVWLFFYCFFFFQAEDGIRDLYVTGVQTCALPIFQAGCVGLVAAGRVQQDDFAVGRSEERRVGKECRSRWSSYHKKKKEQASTTLFLVSCVFELFSKRYFSYISV